MKFSEIEYKRPDIESIEEEFNSLLNKFDKANNVDMQNDVIKDINKLRMDFQTMNTLAHIRYSIETTNKAYETEQEYFDTNTPIYEGLVHNYYISIINSKFRKELEAKWGKQLFAFAETIIKTHKPEIVDDLKTENRLKTDYTKIIASAKIPFEGEDRNLAGLVPFIESNDRDIRKRANKVKWEFFTEHAEEFDRIYDELVKVRDRMAKKLGFKNYVEMGYARMGRTDYNADMVAVFRKQVKDHITPIAVKLKDRQARRLELDSLKHYDQPVDYKDGNAKPEGNPEWIMNCAAKMYNELSTETGEFFNFMVENELMDLVTKQGKDTGGYCAYLENYKSPFIFSNFNGTSGDVEVLTHEAGHAFQAYSSKDFSIPEYLTPTLEACEIHSMSMEFLTWPWMNCFFNKQTEKFKYSHLKDSLIFIPYGVTVDEFQHYVYENPDATPEMRKKAWLEVEKKFLPYMDYDGNEFLEEGGRWQQQRHIYMSPFYYIDYCLAQICAFQFWKRATENGEQALYDYIELCKAGGSMSFLNLVKLAKLVSPFDENCLNSFVSDVVKWLDDFDVKYFKKN